MSEVKLTEVVGVRDAYIPLLLLADESEAVVRGYLNDGHLFAIQWDERVVGCVLVFEAGSDAEIKNLAVDDDYQRRGIGRQAVKQVIEQCRTSGYRKVIVGTGNSSIGNIAFYQRCGFRMSHVRKNFFRNGYKHEIWEDGIQCTDMLVFEYLLADTALPEDDTAGLHHVEVNVANLEVSVAFWEWLLLELGYQPYQNWETGRSWVKADTYLVFVETDARYRTFSFHRRHTGLNHLAFHAPSRTAVDAIRDALVRRGVRMLYDERYPYAGGPSHYAAFFEDPNRIKVEIVAP